MKIAKDEKKFFMDIFHKEIYRKRNFNNFEIVGTRYLNILSNFGLEIIKNRKGSWNGYGYDRLPNAYIFTEKDKAKWQKMINTFDKIKEVPEKKVLTQNDIINKWAKRLSSLTNIPLEQAIDIANEKLEYKEEQLEKMNSKQFDRYSIKREKLINKMERENPLRRIEDEEHARRILAASYRHNNTDYDSILEILREEEQWTGIVNPDDRREKARLFAHNPNLMYD